MEKSICSAHNYFWGIRCGGRSSDCSSQGILFRRTDFSQDSRLKRYHACLVRESNKGQWYTNDHSYFLRSHPRLNVSPEHYCWWSHWGIVIKVEWRVSGLNGRGEDDNLQVSQWGQRLTLFDCGWQGFVFFLFLLLSSWMNILAVVSFLSFTSKSFFN